MTLDVSAQPRLASKTIIVAAIHSAARAAHGQDHQLRGHHRGNGCALVIAASARAGRRREDPPGLPTSRSQWIEEACLPLAEARPLRSLRPPWYTSAIGQLTSTLAQRAAATNEKRENGCTSPWYGGCVHARMRSSCASLAVGLAGAIWCCGCLGPDHDQGLLCDDSALSCDGGGLNASSSAPGSPSLPIASEEPASLTARIAIDDERAYWTFGRRTSDAPPERNGTVNSAALTGGMLTTLAPAQYVPTFIALGANDVFWSDQFTRCACTDVRGRLVPSPSGGLSAGTLAAWRW